MEWWLLLIVIFGGLLCLLALSMPVAFAFLVIIELGVLWLQGGERAFHSMVLSMYSSLSSFTLLPIPLFILMGEILWHSRIALRAIDVLDKLLGRIPGRLSVLTVFSGTLFSSLSGSTMANTALLGTVMLPEMERRGYDIRMSAGPILASGGLAMIVPPSALAVVLATVGHLSVGRILVGALVPGFIMAVLYLTYIFAICRLRPALTPSYVVTRAPAREKLVGLLKYILPLGVIVFLVSGSIVIGMATPTEAAALGSLGSFVLAATYRALSWDMIVKSIKGTVEISVMMLAILAGAIGFSQILAYSGASSGLLNAVAGLNIDPILIVICLLLVVIFLGMLMDQIAIMMITLPIFVPIINNLGYDPIWFGVMMLIALEIGLSTPPFGVLLFVMKGVAPPHVTLRQIYFAGLPFIACDIIALIVVMLFPRTVSWLQDMLYQTS